MIAIIDYDAGNLKSVEKALQYLGEECIVTRDKEKLLKADKIIFEISSAISTANCPYCGKEFILDIKEKYRIFPYKERRLFYLF